MNKEEKLERAVVKVVDDMMQRVLDKVLVTEPFDEIDCITLNVPPISL